MLHTLTLNPTLDLTYLVPDFRHDDTNRASVVYRAPGGKGINVSRVAKRLGHPTVALGFLGGHTGLEVAELLEAEGVRTWFVASPRSQMGMPSFLDADGRQKLRQRGHQAAPGVWKASSGSHPPPKGEPGREQADPRNPASRRAASSSSLVQCRRQRAVGPHDHRWIPGIATWRDQSPRHVMHASLEGQCGLWHYASRNIYDSHRGCWNQA